MSIYFTRNIHIFGNVCRNVSPSPTSKCLKEVLNLHSFPIAAAVNFLPAPFVFTHHWHLNSCELVYQMSRDLEQQTRSRTRDAWDQAVTSLLLGEPKQVTQALLAAFSVHASAVSWKSNPSPPSFKKDTQPTLLAGFYLFFFFPSLFFSICCLSIFLPFSHHQLKTISHPSAGQINSVPGPGRKAQRVQLASISRQGGKDDRERCWNKSSVWAPTWFSLDYKSKHYGGCV